MPDTFEAVAETAPYPIRRMQRGDEGRIATFVAGLDSDTLQHRFDRFMPRAAIVAHYRALDWDRAVLLTWEVGPDIRGLVEVHLYRAAPAVCADPIEAEIAPVVARDWRGRGIGQLLLGSALAAADRRGAARSTVVLSARDHALACLARKLGFAVDAGNNQAVFAHRSEIRSL